MSLFCVIVYDGRHMPEETRYAGHDDDEVEGTVCPKHVVYSGACTPGIWEPVVGKYWSNSSKSLNAVASVAISRKSTRLKSMGFGW